jgi:hypothetical protein
MTLPSSGPMSAAMINVELGRASNAAFDINGTAERTLAGIPSGTIKMSDFYGKSSAGIISPPDRTWSKDYMYGGGTAAALTWLNVFSDGTVRCMRGSSPFGEANIVVYLDNWYSAPAAGVGTGRFVRATLLSGSPPNNGGGDSALDTWISGASATWSCIARITSNSQSTTRSMVLRVEWSDSTSGPVKGSAVYSMMAQCEGIQ